LACLELKLNELCHSTNSHKFVLSDLAYLNKNGGFNALVSRVFFQSRTSIEEVETRRLNTLALLKNKNVVDEMTFRYLYSIYKNVYLGRLNLEYCEEQSDAWRKSCKSIMTSLKKMMVLKTKKSKKIVEAKQRFSALHCQPGRQAPDQMLSDEEQNCYGEVPILQDPRYD